MPEGPTIVILKEEAQIFTGKKIIEVSGNTKIDKNRFQDQTVLEFRSWGKHFLIRMKDFTIRIHFMLFGSYAINSQKINRAPRLQLVFDNGEINFYACSVKILEGDLEKQYDWCTDVMHDCWNEAKAKEKLEALPGKLVCDALLDQDIFAGVGNIIKNEVLFRIMVHPESPIGKLPAAKKKELIKEARNYSFQFLEWKRIFELKQHYQVHTRSICPRCNIPLVRKHLGTTHRRSFFCTNCQKLYA